MDTKQNFHGFNGLRFISITTVILLHLFTFKENFGLTEMTFPLQEIITYYGVQFFFAGSGFLITYLLLAEFKKNATVSLKDFYLRRILRLWPAYYLLIILALLVVLKLPFFDIPELTAEYLQADYTKSNLLYFLFLPHIQPHFFPTAPYIHQTYTVGIEMQFYFLWGLIFFLIPKFTKKLFIGILVGAIILNFTHDFFYENWVQMKSSFVVSLLLKIATYIEYSRFSTFALGGLFAYAFFEEKQWLSIFKSPLVQAILYLVVLFSLYYDIYIPFCRDEYIAFLILCILTAATYKKTSIINFSAGWLSFLGKISYGIYLFHIFAIVFAIKICTEVLEFDVTTNFQLGVLIAITMGLSILFGLISYYTIEKYFLNIKKRFQKI
ncbi:acyltransferase family protein [Ferruginibacter sp. SUN002]|uniref:acyltransferase family protein n=1 Tax=Ferruginibacter sp. SUN002 TaxID=2937789 RepID=UPI003D35C20F